MTRSLLALALVFSASSLTARVPFTCFYPVNADFFRLETADGGERMFQRGFPDTRVLNGEGDWQGVVNGHRATLRSPGDNPQVLSFADGLPSGGDGFVATTNDSVKSLFPSRQAIADMVAEADKSDIWKDSGRLRLKGQNPNIVAVVLGSLALLAFVLLMHVRRWYLRILLGLAFVAISTMEFLTESRGAFVASAVALALALGMQLRRRITWRSAIVVLAVLLVGAAAMLLSNGRFTTDLFGKDEGNELRRDILRNVPVMVAESPYGAGLGNGGATYLVWHRVEDKSRIVRTLISSHLTWLVEFGNVGRFAYVFGWLALLSLLAVQAVRKSLTLPLAEWVFLGAAAMFNPVLESPIVWCIPALALLPMLSGRFRPGWKVSSIVCVCSAAAACAILLSLIYIGRKGAGDVKLTVSRQCVVVGQGEPKVWIVGDEFVVGGWTFVGNEILSYYESSECSVPLAYVETLDALPQSAEKLVLTGRFAEEYLERWNDPAKRDSLCKADALLVVSPSVPAAEFSPEMAGAKRIRAVVGSLAARFDSAYSADIPRWVRIVPGALLYIPNWVRLAIEF